MARLRSRFVRMLSSAKSRRSKGASCSRRLRYEWLEHRRVLATITVTSSADNVVEDGMVTLREAIESTNAGANVNADVPALGAYGTEDTIEFDASLLSGETITLTSGQLTITEDLTITGLGADRLAVSGNNSSRVFEIESGVTAALDQLTVTGGQVNRGGGILNNGTLSLTESTVTGNSADGNGGGIWNAGTLWLTQSTVADNSAGFVGGGIRNAGTLTLTQSSVTGNSAVTNGGGIWTSSGSTTTLIQSTVAGNSANTDSGGGIRNAGMLTVTDSTISGNSALAGGGIFISSLGTATLINSTVSGNVATFLEGGGIRNAGELTVSHSTITGNSAGTEGGGLWNTQGSGAGTATLSHTIVAGNMASGAGDEIRLDGGTVNLDDFNLIGDDSKDAAAALSGVSAGATDILATSDQANVALNAILETTLADNGGPTETHALVAGSPAVDAGDPMLAMPTDFDQRGAGFPRVVGAAIDIGAFELQDQNLPPVASDDDATTGEDVPVVIDVLANDTDPDGDVVMVANASDPANGSVAINPDGTITYTPDADFHGVDSFMYTLVDSEGLTDAATVTVKVLSPSEQLTDLQAAVLQLSDEGTLNRGQGKALTTKLMHIQSKLNTGQTHVSLNMLKSFSNQVAGLINDGVLTPEQGQPLLNAADDLRMSLSL